MIATTVFNQYSHFSLWSFIQQVFVDFSKYWGSSWKQRNKAISEGDLAIRVHVGGAPQPTLGGAKSEKVIMSVNPEEKGRASGSGGGMGELGGCPWRSREHGSSGLAKV